MKLGDAWFCSSSCAEGRVSASPRQDRVPEAWLYARPRRFFRKRLPKELQSTKTGS